DRAGERPSGAVELDEGEPGAGDEQVGDREDGEGHGAWKPSLGYTAGRFFGSEAFVAGEPVVLDGSEGEGGGQILRTALTLSLVTQRPLVIEKIRANRQPSGLRPQHLACVRGAEAISGSSSEGARVDG